MWRLRPLLYPVLLLLAGGWLYYDNFIAPNPNLRFPKAEAAAFIFLAIGAVALPFAIYRAVRPKLVAVGMEATVLANDAAVSGVIVAVNGGSCTLRTANGDIDVARGDLVIAKPAAG